MIERLFRLAGLWLVALAASAPAVRAAEPPSKPADALAAARAENEELRRTLVRQKEEIAKLQEQVVRLEAKLNGTSSATPPDNPGTRGGAQRPVAAPDAPRPAGAAPQPRTGSKRVVYVVDASGSMIDKFPRVRDELRKGMAQLRPETVFNVLVAADEQVTPFKPQPVRASPGVLAEVDRFLSELKTAGTSNMLPAVQLAVRQRADVIWLVSDGDFPNNNEFLAQLQAVNVGRRAKINTVCAATDWSDPVVATFVDALVKIAGAHGGRCYDLTGRTFEPPAVRAAAAEAQAEAARPPSPRPRAAESRPGRPSIFDIEND